MITHAGTYKAKAFEVMLGESKTKRTPFVGVKFRITEGEFAGQVVKWEGYLSETTSGKSKKTPAERTIESLQYCGWMGDDIGAFATGVLQGLDSNEVELVVEMEDYEDRETGEQRQSPKVQWVNRPGGRVQFAGEAVDVAKAKAFGAKFRGLALKLKAQNGALPNGAKAPPPPASSDIADDEIPF
jgi:hypothetical protein